MHWKYYLVVKKNGVTYAEIYKYNFLKFSRRWGIKILL